MLGEKSDNMTTKFEPNKFRHSNLIVVEGEDDAHFIFSLFKNIDPSLLEKIHIHWVCGNTKLFSGNRIGSTENEMLGLEAMISDQTFMDNVRNIAVIFDAEKSATESFANILKQCKEANKSAEEIIKNDGRASILNLPDKVGEFHLIEATLLKPNLSVFLFDVGNRTGTLEDFYLSTLNNEDGELIQDCVGKMTDCLHKKGIPIDDQKVQVQSFLAIKDPAWKTIGYAASKGKIDFEQEIKKENSPISLLKKFLLDFANLK